MLYILLNRIFRVVRRHSSTILYSLLPLTLPHVYFRLLYPLCALYALPPVHLLI